MPGTQTLELLSRTAFESAASSLGIRSAFKDIRCFNEYQAYAMTGELYADTPYQWLLVRRGATLAAQNYVPAECRELPHTCDTCGLDARTCDCW